MELDVRVRGQEPPDRRCFVGREVVDDYMLDSLYPSVKDRVSDYGRDDAGNELAVGELIEAIPQKTSEYFRYGFLLNETYGNAVIHTNGDVKVDGRNVTHMEFRLCALLKAFVQEEAWW